MATRLEFVKTAPLSAIRSVPFVSAQSPPVASPKASDASGTVSRP